MAKPVTLDGYTDPYTVDCESVLATLLRGLGRWQSVGFVYWQHQSLHRFLERPLEPQVFAQLGWWLRSGTLVVRGFLPLHRAASLLVNPSNSPSRRAMRALAI